MSLEYAKKVKTYDNNGKENGFLIELSKDGRRTTSYLTCCLPGSFKGYHLHKVREASYVCIRGKVDIEIATPSGWELYTLDSSNSQRLHIPINRPTGLKNPYSEEAWIINVPSPSYDPLLDWEQEDFDFEGAERWIENNSVWSK